MALHTLHIRYTCVTQARARGVGEACGVTDVTDVTHTLHMRDTGESARLQEKLVDADASGFFDHGTHGTHGTPRRGEGATAVHPTPTGSGLTSFGLRGGLRARLTSGAESSLTSSLTKSGTSDDSAASHGAEVFAARRVKVCRERGSAGRGAQRGEGRLHGHLRSPSPDTPSPDTPSPDPIALPHLLTPSPDTQSIHLSRHST